MPTSRKYKILAVDDYEPHRYALEHTLQKAGFEVATVGTGADTLQQAAAHPDLILLDIGLPDINGLQVCEQLKANPDTAAIPIIFITATHDDEFFLLEAEKRGASGFLTYPLDGDTLVKVIRACMKQLEELAPVAKTAAR